MPETESGNLKTWKKLEEAAICKTRVFTVMKSRMKMGSGPEADFFTLHAPGWINVLAVDKQGDVILVEQYRHGISRVSLEIPAGVIDKGEDPLQTAKRELSEETGYKAGKWISLGKISSNPALFNNYCHLFAAIDCEKATSQHTDEHEDISVKRVPFSKFEEMVHEGTVHHALAVATLAKYKLWKEIKS